MWLASLLNYLHLRLRRLPPHASCHPREPAPASPQGPAPAANPLPPGLTLTDEFRTAFEQMEHSTSCMYLTGKAGTGKSTLLKYFRDHTRKKVVVLAPTGIAAVNVNGMTINSFFGFPATLVLSKHIRRSEHREQLFRRLETIVIDEVSMVRPDVIDGMDYALRVHRQDPRPFGGVQLLFFGDLYQLPPVVTKDLAEYFFEHYGGAYFFNAVVFKQMPLQRLELQTVFRQKDETFKRILNQVRVGQVSTDDLARLNTRTLPAAVQLPGDPPLVLTTTSHAAQMINAGHMHALPGGATKFQAIVKGDVPAASYPAELELTLKIGTPVLLTKNDPAGRWANGTRAVVEELGKDAITVSIGTSRYSISRTTWEIVAYQWQPKSRSIVMVVVGTFAQFPFRPAWAMTIHKSQGLSVDRLLLDLGSGAFAHGQTYVALSRCRSLDRLFLSRPVRRADIIVDPQVRQFLAEGFNCSEGRPARDV